MAVEAVVAFQEIAVGLAAEAPVKQLVLAQEPLDRATRAVRILVMAAALLVVAEANFLLGVKVVLTPEWVVQV